MGKKSNRHFKPNVGDELKIAVALAMKRLAQNTDQKELEFPSSLSSEERMYIHRHAHKLGLDSKSRGKAPNRFLTVYKKEGSTIMSKDALLILGEDTLNGIVNVLQKWPLTAKERQDLLLLNSKERPEIIATNVNNARINNADLRDLCLVRSVGRLNPGPPQVPPLPGHSELSVEGQRLPIWAMRDQILSAVYHNQVVLISGETGSGKTTQVPQMLLQEAASLGKPCRIYCTQPRRISSLTIAERVAQERGERVGYTVGYQIRLESKLSMKTLLTFCTTGVMLRTLMAGDSTLNTVTHILVDEVHERDRYTDFLLIVLKDWLPKFRHLKLILMSANLDANMYAKYFNNCPVIDVPGKCYPVNEYYLEDVLNITKYNSKKMEEARKLLSKKKDGASVMAEWSKKLLYQIEHTQTDDAKADVAHINATGKNAASGCVNSEMDKCIALAFEEEDDEEHFSQMLYLIMSEDVSPDYQHSETFATCLMIASVKGCIEMMENLLALGANINICAANGWTAADWAHKSGQQEALDYLLSFSMCEGLDLQFGNGTSVKPGTTSQNSITDTQNATAFPKIIAIPSHGSINNVSLATIGSRPTTSTPSAYMGSSSGINDHIGNTQTSISETDQELLDVYNLSNNEDDIDIQLLYQLCLHIHNNQPPGAVMVFLPGYDDIMLLRDTISNEDAKFTAGGKYVIYCLHSSMQSSDQKKVFRTAHGFRKIILCTNIAETSVTINDVVYVVDSGKVKEVSFDSISGSTSLHSVWVSKASATQRRGRAGRCQPGLCYHLFSRSRFNSLQLHQTPEILRTPLQELCLHSKLLSPPKMLIADFLAKAPEPPGFMIVKTAVQTLKSMDALDSMEDVTELGHHLLDMPLPPYLGKMVIMATIVKCLDPVLTIACCLAYKDPFVLPRFTSERKKVKTTKNKMASGTYSDHFILLKAFQCWQKACTDGNERQWCNENYISGAIMEMVQGMRAQVLSQLRGAGFVRARGPGDIRDVNSNSDNWAVVKAALTSGIYPNLVRVDRELTRLRTEKECKVRIHPHCALLEMNTKTTGQAKSGSRQFDKQVIHALPSDWLIFDELIRIGVVAHMRTVTLVSPLTVALMAGPIKTPAETLSYNSHIEGEESSDSDSEECPLGMTCLLRIDPWVQFRSDPKVMQYTLQLRQKLQTLILRRLRAPNKPLTQGDEDIVRIVAATLYLEDQAIGLAQPVGVGQRPRTYYSMHGNSQDVNYCDADDSSRLPSRRPSTSSPTGITTGTGNSARDSVISSKTSTRNTQQTAANFGSQDTTAMSLTDELQALLVTDKEEGATRSNKHGGSGKGQGAAVDANKNGSKTHGNDVAASAANKSSPTPSSEGKCRYFLIRAMFYKQIEVSQHRSLWAFSFNTERKLLQAAQNGSVILVFCLHRGNQFNGFARFWGQKSEEKCPEISNTAASLGPLYKIDWIKKWHINFSQTRHLYNPYNENLQVHLGRDGQEIEASIGEQLIKVWGKNGGSNGPLLVSDPTPPHPPRHPIHPPHPYMSPYVPPHPFHRPPFRGYTGFGPNFQGNFRGGPHRGGFRH